MKKIDLTKIKARPNLYADETEINFCKEVANAIYVKAKSAVECRLALRILDAKGEIEVSDEELGVIKATLADFLYWAKKPLLEAIGEKCD